MSCTHWTRGLRRNALVACFVISLSACSGGGGGDDRVFAAADVTVAGSVGDGPVINADLSFIDAEGSVIGQTTSDDQANYRFVIPANTPLPVRVVASGGTDLVTGRALDFNLVGVLGEDAEAEANTLNLSPLSTITVRALECTGARFSFAHLSEVWGDIRKRVGMGLDPDLLANPMFDEINEENVAAVVLSSEALAEVVRRTATAMNNAGFETDAADVFSSIACDLSVDHSIDGRGEGGDSRISAVFRSASAAVALEMIAGRLEVDDQPATTLMDAAVAQILPSASGASVLDVVPSTELQQQLISDLLLLQGEFEDPSLLELIETIQQAEPARLPEQVDQELSERSMQTLRSAVDSLALADAEQLQQLSVDMAAQPEVSAPYISLFASQTLVVAGEPISLSWAVSGSDRCVADGAWSGEQPSSGSASQLTPNRSADYRLTCYNSGGSNTAIASVRVISEDGDELAERAAPVPTPVFAPRTTPRETTPGPVPTPGEPMPSQPIFAQPPVMPAPTPEPVAPANLDVTLLAAKTRVARGAVVDLTWRSQGAETCRATDGWNGGKGLRGSRQMGPLTNSTTFKLTCSSGNRSSSAIARVEVFEQGTLSLRWKAPTENEDGSPIAGLGGFKVYYGQESGQYTGERTINDGAAEGTQLALPQDTYYLAMTAIDRNGVESALSNEIVKVSR